MPKQFENPRIYKLELSTTSQVITGAAENFLRYQSELIVSKCACIKSSTQHGEIAVA
ncbi:hypothetical protein SNOG_04343 [Parastagonospora nodorum SN15]|uniref:Uncharacterized protein n=1 Tax=Phaeosphaeria nodorum (strain SN15 / ATCC MYA-4574 / FGSC 10173) TaxID=321614 RepID=Q0UV71_PHANO|nr:hypothetical protein SNOG_04343 [Parastagonospora nodorum SN15]EAT88103.1 hypothetical protein SNOG_04343 [Parastagonospora nodorum SN15]